MSAAVGRTASATEFFQLRHELATTARAHAARAAAGTHDRGARTCRWAGPKPRRVAVEASIAALFCRRVLVRNSRKNGSLPSLLRINREDIAALPRSCTLCPP